MSSPLRDSVDAQTLERTYVATMLAEPSLLDEHRLSPDMLTVEAYAVVLAGMQKLRHEGQRVTPTSLRLTLGSASAEAITALREAPIELDVAAIVARIRSTARAREYARGAATLGALAARGDLKGCRDAIGRMMLAHDAGEREQPVMALRELLANAVQVITTEGAAGQTQIAVGMDAVDSSYKLSPGSMLVVGAQTNVGKTSLVVTWMLSIARRGTPVGIVSVEDPAEDFGAKVLGSLAGINPTRMWSNKITPDEWRRMMAMTGEANEPLHFAHVASRGLDDVLARIEFMARVRGCRVVAVDYLQAIAHRPGKDIRERINGTLEELIALCGRLGVALILCSQLARPDKGSPFKEPHLIDLKESGEIENRAQCVIMLWREDDKPGSPVKAKVAKAKRQPIGVRFALTRDPDTGMLVDEREVSPFAPPHRDEDARYAVGGWNR